MKPYYEDDDSALYLGLAEDVLPILPDSCADIGISDPPYSEHVHGKSLRAGASAPMLNGRGKASPASSISRKRDIGFTSLTPELRTLISVHSARLVKRWSLVFCDVESATDWRESLTAVALQYVRTGVWVKLGSTPQFTGDRPAPGFEAVVIAHPEGRKRWNGGGTAAVWTFPTVLNGHQEERMHSTQKPEQLMGRLVSLFSDPGETILDMTAGSGTTLISAKRLGRKSIGIEMSEAYCEIAANRLRREASQSKLVFKPKAKQARLFGGGK